MHSTTFNINDDFSLEQQGDFMRPFLGTASVAKAFAGVLLVSTPTYAATTPHTMPEVASRGVYQGQQFIGSLSQSAYSFAAQQDTAERKTTPVEELIGEIRAWNLLANDWDGEGSSAPLAQSLHDAENFARLLETIPVAIPEPMLLASGNSALYWHDGDFYADLEFLGSHRIAYFIRRSGDKHKGVLEFKNEEMPPVLKALLVA